jgi:hypothetical protein
MTVEVKLVKFRATPIPARMWKSVPTKIATHAGIFSRKTILARKAMIALVVTSITQSLQSSAHTAMFRC